MQGGGGVGQTIVYSTTSTGGAHQHGVGTYASGIHAHTITTTIAMTGSGQSYSAVQSSLLVTWYIKL
ncbi:MAG: hypothetical protein ACRDDO_06105, partial [Plesiomonas shigelloides]